MEQTENEVLPQTFIVKTIAGLEEVLATELQELGGANVQILTRAVSFEGDKRMLYKANYCLRTALRILVPVHTFQMADEDDLYNQINAYPWENFLTLQKTLAVDAVVSDSELTHSHYVALRTKDAIVDRFRTLNNGRRPDVDTENPHVRINIHIRGSICNVSIDSSGASLHKRGYRVSNAEAPMSEVLAAGLIMLTGWKRDTHFIDPMCGSGTLVIEAAMYANNFPAGMYRKEFGFMHFPDFDEALWNEVTTEALDQQTEFDYQIIGTDISPKNLSSARANLKSARLHKDVKLAVSPFAALKAPEGKPGLIIINPPYGERIRLNDIIGLYKSIGNTLKQEFPGYQAWVISSDQKALSFIGLRPSAKIPVFNGPLECRFEHFDLYRGSKRGRYMDSPDGEQQDKNRYEDRIRDGKPDWRKKEAPDAVPEKFDPAEYKARKRNDDSRFGTRKPFGEKPAFDRSDRPYRKEDKPFEKRVERSKPEKFKLKPLTRIEDRSEYLAGKSKEPIPGDILTETPVVNTPETESAGYREPSKGNKFTEKRDYKLSRTRELRPRKPKEAASDLPVEKTSRKAPEPLPSKPKPTINFDDLED